MYIDASIKICLTNEINVSHTLTNKTTFSPAGFTMERDKFLTWLDTVAVTFDFGSFRAYGAVGRITWDDKTNP